MVQRDAIYRKMESSELSQVKRNLKLTSIAKSTNSNLLLLTPSSHFKNMLSVRNIEIKVDKSRRVFTKTRFYILIAHWPMRSAALKIK